MLHINDADQSAMPTDENKKQEQSELEPLPWEVGKGFLWGLPKTAWLVLTHPSRAFGAPQVTGLLRVWLFAALFGLIIYITSFLINCVRYYYQDKHYSYTEILAELPDAISNLFQLALLDGIARGILFTIITDFFVLPIRALSIWSLLFLLSFSLKFPGISLSFSAPDKCFRIACYVSVASIFFVFDDLTKIIGLLFRIYLIFIAIRTSYRVPSWKAILISVFGDLASRSTSQYFVDLFFPLLKHPLF